MSGLGLFGVVLSSALRGYGEGTKAKAVFDREDEALEKQLKAETAKAEIEAANKFRIAQLDLEIKQADKMADREFEAGQNAVAGTFASSEDLYDITGRYQRNFWSVRDTKPTSLQGKVSLANSFFTTPSPFTGSQNPYIADLLNRKHGASSQFAPEAKERLINGFFDGYATALAELVRDAQYPVKPLVKFEGDQSPKTLEQQNVPSISPLITRQLINTYNKLESVEAKEEFEERVDRALELAYGKDVDGLPLYDINFETLPKPLNPTNEEPTVERTIKAPDVEVEPNKYTLFDVKELDRRISYAASNPRVDPTITALKNAQGQTVDADGNVDNGLYYKRITNQTRDSVNTIAQFISNGTLLYDGNVTYLSDNATAEDEVNYNSSINQIVSTFGIAEAANIISVAMPDGFGNRVNTAPMRVGETKEQYLRRVAIPEINLDNKPRSYYADIFTNLDRTQRAILDGLGLLKGGKPIVGFAGALYTKAYALFSEDGQIDNLFGLIDLFSTTPDENETLGDYTNEEIESSKTTLADGKRKFDQLRKDFAGAGDDKAKRSALLKQMYQDSVLLRYLQVEIVYNIARTLENPDGSGARLSRTDIEQMMEGTQLGAALSKKDGIIAMLTYLQTRNNNRYQIAAFLKNPSNYQNGKKRAALQMVVSADDLESKFINGGRPLSAGLDENGKPIAVSELESLLMTAIIDGEKEFNSRDATLQLNVSGGNNTRVFRGFENRLGKTDTPAGYSTLNNTSMALGKGQELSFEERVQKAIGN